MKKYLLPIYHKLPPAVKNAVASWYGGRRNSWRYDETTDRRVAKAMERESWNREQWDDYQQKRLAHILNRARHHVPYYKKYWDARTGESEADAWKNLDNWPVLTKDEVRDHNREFLANDCDPKSMYSEHTSGSTGKPLSVWWSKNTTLEYYALFERRIRHWHGLHRKDDYLLLGGQLIVPGNQQKPPFWVKNQAMHQLYMSAYHLSPTNIGHYAGAIRGFGPQYVYGYASTMYNLARLIEENGLEVPSLKAAISNAEFFFDYQQETISRVFRCKPVNTYGMSELVAAGNTHDGQNIILWPEVGLMEVFDYDRDQPVTGEGRFICTSLINDDMPLIRYEVGDGGSVEDCTVEDRIRYKKITSIGGRIDDFIITTDGRKIGRMDPIFKAGLAISEAQIIQEDYEDFRILVVPADGFSARDEKIIKDNFMQRVGEGKVRIEKVKEIPRSAMGKYRSVISKIKKD